MDKGVWPARLGINRDHPPHQITDNEQLRHPPHRSLFPFALDTATEPFAHYFEEFGAMPDSMVYWEEAGQLTKHEIKVNQDMKRRVLSDKLILQIQEALAKTGHTNEQVLAGTPSFCNYLIDRIHQDYKGSIKIRDILRYFQEVPGISDTKVAAIYRRRNTILTLRAQHRKKVEDEANGIGSYDYLTHKLALSSSNKVEKALEVHRVNPNHLGAMNTRQLGHALNFFIWNTRGKVDSVALRLLNRYLFQVVGISKENIMKLDAYRAGLLNKSVLELTESPASRIKKTIVRQAHSSSQASDHSGSLTHAEGGENSGLIAFSHPMGRSFSAPPEDYITSGKAPEQSWNEVTPVPANYHQYDSYFAQYLPVMHQQHYEQYSRANEQFLPFGTASSMGTGSSSQVYGNSTDLTNAPIQHDYQVQGYPVQFNAAASSGLADLPPIVVYSQYPDWGGSHSSQASGPLYPNVFWDDVN